MRLIDADDLINDREIFIVIGAGDNICIDISDIAKAPTIEAEPLKHGRWIDAYPDIEPNPMFMYGICSECGFEQGISKYLNYCPNCGAKMDGAE